MKWKIAMVVLLFSLACNVVAVVAFFVSRPAGACPARSLARVEGEKLELTPEQQEQFDRLDAAYHEARRAVAGRLLALRRALLRRVLAGSTDPAGIEELLGRVGEEQAVLQRQLIENMRAKVRLLDPGQREVYRKLVENLAGGCGCGGCAVNCH